MYSNLKHAVELIFDCMANDTIQVTHYSHLNLIELKNWIMYKLLFMQTNSLKMYYDAMYFELEFLVTCFSSFHILACKICHVIWPFDEIFNCSL